MSKKLTIVYLTFRRFPRFEWFASSLAREFRTTPGIDFESVQIVVIDGRLWYDGDTRAHELREAAAGRIPFKHHPPKPTPWQGPSRQTTKDYFCAANARNTAFAYAQAPHVAFVDDLSVLLPGWLKEHLRAAEGRYVLAGTTCKYHHLKVDELGSISHGDASSDGRFQAGQDSRLAQIQGETARCHGGWLYGGTFSIPLETALIVNGQDEIYDSNGGEDWDFGIRVERTGVKMIISKLCGTYEDEEGHYCEAAMVRLDKPWQPHRSVPPRPHMYRIAWR